MDILDGFDEMALAENEVDVIGLLDSDRNKLHASSP
jgi:hypothetical protein